MLACWQNALEDYYDAESEWSEEAKQQLIDLVNHRFAAKLGYVQQQILSMFGVADVNVCCAFAGLWSCSTRGSI